jgi:hypothetical protein
MHSDSTHNGDGLFVYGTDPTNPDTDGDGTDIALGFDPLDPNDTPPVMTNLSSLGIAARGLYGWRARHEDGDFIALVRADSP